MPIDSALNRVLKEMWRLDEKMTAGELLEKSEKEFYNNHVKDIANYYSRNDSYWNGKKIID